MEACSSAHCWARRFREMGLEIRQISPQYVIPFIKTNKNDPNDAEGIAEAASRMGPEGPPDPTSHPDSDIVVNGFEALADSLDL